jgi:hypothetical protein
VRQGEAEVRQGEAEVRQGRGEGEVEGSASRRGSASQKGSTSRKGSARQRKVSVGMQSVLKCYSVVLKVGCCARRENERRLAELCEWQENKSAEGHAERKSARAELARRRCAFRSQVLPINIYLRFFSGCAFKLAILQWCMRGRQCDFRCFLACKVKAIPSQRDGICSLVLCLALWRSLFLLRSESVCVPMCKASDRKCALSLFGDAVSASYVPFQSDHKVMAHNEQLLIIVIISRLSTE